MNKKLTYIWILSCIGFVNIDNRLAPGGSGTEKFEKQCNIYSYGPAVNRRKFISRVVGGIGAALLPGCRKSEQILSPSPVSIPNSTKGEITHRKQSVRFGFLTDLHYADIPPAGARVYGDSDNKAADCIEVCNAQRIDFIIGGGDLKDQGSDGTSSLSYLRAIEAELQKFDGPTYHVLGNHDADNISKTQFLTNITNTNIPPASKYYSFDIKGVHFVVLDANYRSDGIDYDRGNFDWKDANIPQIQLDWMTSDLASTRYPVIVFVHQLLDGMGDHYVRNADAVRAVLENSGKVIAVFQGHYHPGSYTRINGIHYYTLKAMVEGTYPARNAYAIVEVEPGKRITIDGYFGVDDKELIL
jgi:3',5'-cyclic AMP phosphodiesterase CpdA